MKKLIWHNEKRKVNDLLPFEKNPRKISDKQMADLKRSLKKYNLVETPAVTIDGKILAGHQRIKALQLLGRGDDTIDVRVPNRKLTPKEYEQYLLISNASGGDWDFEKLKAFQIDDLLMAGFGEDELMHIFDDNLETELDDFQEEKELEKIKTTDIKRVCLWIKNGQNPVPNVAFSKCFEPVSYGITGKPYLSKSVQNLNEVMNKEVNTGNRLIEDILDLLDIWLVKRLAGNEYEHSTSKPPTLHEKAIRRCTRPGDIILDIYSGSGSTLLAGEMLKRKVYGCELEPIFCQLIINRYEKYANTKAKKLN
jgi:hypothetical protein